ncbi:hypothetical protein HFO56_00835 [Rhizobium laguerreae]|uniref:hypothetical protein n=1 Tax=Rhizobium laguerreae TaxID=1076926 RepID=UPI001C9073A0|nr:hypothetical protein [Rhizobium laguerreae]MBY3150975.1 hypothetical protein [Rhizobium laguerreae]
MPNIKLIEQALERLIEAAPELAPQATNALSAIRASQKRAELPEKRLANTARHNIAAYIMGFVAAAYETRRVSGDFVCDLATLIDHATAIKAKPSDRHIPMPDYSPGHPWHGKEGGPWKREAGEGRTITLVHQPNMPGGQWTISIQDVPCLYGTDPLDVEERTLRLLSLVDASKRSAPSLRPAISWA